MTLRHRHRHRRRGVTLIEMLIAITLVTLLSTGILYAMRLGLGALEQTNRKFTDNRRALGSLRVLDQQLAGVVPAQITCGGGRADQGPLFFSGAQNSLQFVSSYTLEEAARGYPRIVEYVVMRGDPARGGGVRLIMQETPYTGPFSLQPYCGGLGSDPFYRSPTAVLRPVRLGPRPFVIADQLAYCRLSYLRVHPNTFQRNWEPSYTGAVLPAAVRIEMAPLRPDPARVQLTTTTISLHVSRTTFEPYADIDQPQ
jgi:prepilin-type N-terminal cleavage/methylation domain-containing protein